MSALQVILYETLSFPCRFLDYKEFFHDATKTDKEPARKHTNSQDDTYKECLTTSEGQVYTLQNRQNSDTKLGIIGPHGIALRNKVDISSSDMLDLVTLDEIPARSVIKIVSALAVGIVVELHGVSVISRRLIKQMKASLSIGRYIKSTV